MSFTSMIFLFVFLPIALAVYYIAADSAREYVLLAVSLLFYSLGALQYVMLFIISIVITVCLGRALCKIKKHVFRKALLIIGIVYQVGLLGYYKYFGAILSLRGGIKEIQTA